MNQKVYLSVYNQSVKSLHYRLPTLRVKNIAISIFKDTGGLYPITMTE